MSDPEKTVLSTLEEISETLKHISLALLHQARIMDVEVLMGDDEVVGFAISPSAKDYAPDAPMKKGETKAHRGTNAWVWEPPAPLTGVVIVCSQDSTAPLGMRCYAEAKGSAGETLRFPVQFVDTTKDQT